MKALALSSWAGVCTFNLAELSGIIGVYILGCLSMDGKREASVPAVTIKPLQSLPFLALNATTCKE